MALIADQTRGLNPQTLSLPTNRGTRDPSISTKATLIAVLTSAADWTGALDYQSAPAGGCLTGAFVEVPLGPQQRSRACGLGHAVKAGMICQGPVCHPRSGCCPDASGNARIPDAGGRLHADADARDGAACDALSGVGDPPSMRRVYRRGSGEPDRETDARRRVVGVLLDVMATWLSRLSELAEMAGVSASVSKAW